MSVITGRNWASIVDNERVDFESLYEKSILRLAALQANEKIDELETNGEEIPATMRPSLEDPTEVLHMVSEGQAPAWWPEQLGRMAIKLTIRPNGETPEHLSPHPIDPNQRDLGRTEFSNLMRNMLEEAGNPFEGELQIKITRKKDKANLGGWRGEVYVGEKQKKGKDGKDKGGEEKDEMFELMLSQLEKSHEAQQRMFGNASNVIHASASAINAMRGANAPPPWMRGEEGEGMPMWMFMAQEAMKMVTASGVLSGQPQSPAQVGMNVMQHPVQNPGALGGYGNQHGYGPPQLPGPTQDLGYGAYQNHAEPGDFDGVYAHDDDLIDDGFEDEENPYEDEDEFYYDDEDEDESDEDDDEEEEEEPPRRSRNRSRSRKEQSSARSGNPLDGMTPAELQRALGEYIDKNQDKKAELKNLGMSLASKILG